MTDATQAMVASAPQHTQTPGTVLQVRYSSSALTTRPRKMGAEPHAEHLTPILQRPSAPAEKRAQDLTPFSGRAPSAAPSL